jgi:DNA-binding NarL/FixJ family response regulator
MIKVLIVDDEALICEGLRLLLDGFPDIEVIGVCHNGLEAVRFCRKVLPDVVLMDIRMDRCDGVEGTRMIKEMHPEVQVVILTTFMDDEYIHAALSYGAGGYLLKDSSSQLIYEAIKNAYIGNVAIAPRIVQRMVGPSKASPAALSKIIEQFKLSEKDLELIRWICQGLSNKEIADRLYLSEGTVKNNIGKILSKLNLRDRTQIAIFAFRNHLPI